MTNVPIIQDQKTYEPNISLSPSFPQTTSKYNPQPELKIPHPHMKRLKKLKHKDLNIESKQQGKSVG
jgi:hypothetical protein